MQGVSFLCVSLEVLKTTTTTNTNIYHPNMANRARKTINGGGVKSFCAFNGQAATMGYVPQYKYLLTFTDHV
jgi:hypothetical protein